MKKLAPLLLAGVILVIFLALAKRPALFPPPAERPDDCVRAMFTAAREGRVSDYLDAFCDPLRSSLANTARAMGDEKFRQYIKDSAAPVRGIAFSDLTERGQEEATLRFELIFDDHNEVQRVLLKRIGGRWLIADMTPAERTKPPVPYGTKVFE